MTFDKAVFRRESPAITEMGNAFGGMCLCPKHGKYDLPIGSEQSNNVTVTQDGGTRLTKSDGLCQNHVTGKLKPD